MQAGWTNLVLSVRASHPTINWWRVNGLAFAVAFSLFVWCLLLAVALTSSTDRFAVWQFFPNDWHECIGEQLTAAEAVPLAKRLTESLGGRLGTTQRVIIVDDEDFTVFEWRHGEGVIYPPQRAKAEAAP